MTTSHNNTSRAARDKKAEMLIGMGAPYAPLLQFLREAPKAEIRQWASAAPDYNPAFWDAQDRNTIRCLSYAFNRLMPGQNTGQIDLAKHWDISSQPAWARGKIWEYARLQEKIEIELVRPLSSAAMPQGWWIESKVRDMHEQLSLLLAYGLKLLEKPEDLEPNHYPVAFGLEKCQFVLPGDSAYHYARLDASGNWSEMPGILPVVSADSADPLELDTWSAPTCFLQLAAHNNP